MFRRRTWRPENQVQGLHTQGRENGVLILSEFGWASIKGGDFERAAY